MSSNEVKFRLAFTGQGEIASPKLTSRSRRTRAQADCLRQLDDDDQHMPQAPTPDSEDAAATSDCIAPETQQCLSDTVKSLTHSLCANRHIPNLHEIRWFLTVCQSFYDKHGFFDPHNTGMPEAEYLE